MITNPPPVRLLACLLFFYIIPAGIQAQPGNRKERKSYTIEQATSDRAQIHTIAFNGLAFITGSYGADCFFPPGKVADYFGFQYMRDNDSNQLGHNTRFLTNIANNVLSILTPEQVDWLKQLARDQETLYDAFARNRWVLISAFRQNLEAASQGNPQILNKDSVIAFTAALYKTDGELSYHRAAVMGKIIRSLSEKQKAAFDRLRFDNSATWPELPELLDKKSLSHRAHVGVMTYASELFSWYKGSVMADVYFCPERHGTYFGGFYLKDYPAMGNPGYFISTSLTGDAGESFLQVLNPEQKKFMDAITGLQKNNLIEIIRLRTAIAEELRKFMQSNEANSAKVMEWVTAYGKQDGEMSYYYASAFASIAQTLTKAQHEKLKAIRHLDVAPEGTYLYSDPVPFTGLPDASHLLTAPSANKQKAF